MKKQPYTILLLIALLLFHVSFADARPAAKTFPTKSIIIGTYVIDYKVLDPKTIGLAQDTIESSGQKKVFFKSDLTSQKIWVDITDGESINDISDKSSNIVSDAVIDALPLTHWIKEDGSVVIFDTGEIKSINDMHKLLKPRDNDLLKKLIIDYDLAKALFDADEDDEVSEMTKNILSPVQAPLSQSIIDPYDALLDSWDAFTAYLNANGGSSVSIALSAIEKETTFTNREIAVNNAILGLLNGAANSAVKNGLNLLNADIWEAIGKVEAKNSELQDSINTDKSSFLALFKAGQEQILTQGIVNKDYKSAQVAIDKMVHIDHITNDLILDKPAELQILMAVFGQSIGKVKATAAEGYGTSFYEALKKGEPAPTLKVLVDAQVSKLKASIDELKQIIDYIIARLDQPEAQQAILEDAIGAIEEALKDTVGVDSGKGAGTENGSPSTTDNASNEASLVSTQSPEALLSSEKEGLGDMLNTLKALNDTETIEQLDYMDNLQNESDNLYKAFLGALENNDTDLANEIKANMGTLASKQEALYDSFAGLYKETKDAITALEAQKLAENSSSSEEPLSSAEQTPSSILDDRISLLKEELAKFALLLDPTDKQLLDLYTDALADVKNAISEAEPTMIGDTLDTLLPLYTILPDALKSESDFSDLISLLIKASKEAFIANLQDQGDALLELTALLTPSQIKALVAAAETEVATTNTGSGADTPVAGSGDQTGDITGSTTGDTTVADAKASNTDNSQSQNAPSVIVNRNDNGQYILVKVPTINIQGITYTPIKTFYNLFDIDVIWHPENRSVEVKGLMQTELFIGDSQVVKKGEIPLVMDSPMKIINGVSYAPIAYFTTDIPNFIMPNNTDLTLIIIPLK